MAWAEEGRVLGIVVDMLVAVEDRSVHHDFVEGRRFSTVTESESGYAGFGRQGVVSAIASETAAVKMSVAVAVLVSFGADTCAKHPKIVTCSAGCCWKMYIFGVCWGSGSLKETRYAVVAG
jgi:hypothetical protein